MKEENVDTLLHEQIPLDRAAICLDCKIIFRMQGKCPGCGSGEWMLVAKLWDTRAIQ